MKINNYLALIIKLILILSLISSIYKGFWHLASTEIFLLLLMFMPQILKNQYKIKFPREIEILLFISVIAILILETITSALAPIVFGIGVGLSSLLFMYILYSCGQIKKDKILIILFTISFAIFFGTLLEII